MNQVMPQAQLRPFAKLLLALLGIGLLSAIGMGIVEIVFSGEDVRPGPSAKIIGPILPLLAVTYAAFVIMALAVSVALRFRPFANFLVASLTMGVLGLMGLVIAGRVVAVGSDSGASPSEVIGPVLPLAAFVYIVAVFIALTVFLHRRNQGLRALDNPSD